MTIGFVSLVRLLLLTVALVLFLISAVAWRRRRRAPQAATVSLLVAAAALYCFGYAGEVAQTTIAGARFWLQVEYLGIPWIPALWLLLARKHNGLRPYTGFLFPISAIIFVAHLTNPLHGLYDRSSALVSRGPFWVVSVHRGPIAWLNIAYLYGAFFCGAWIYLSKRRSSSRLIRAQNLLLIASCVAPLTGYVVYLGGWSPWGLDLAPLTLSVTAVLAYFAVFRLECFDLVPMARSLVFNSMRDAVLVTDLRHRLVDFNEAAREILPYLAFALPGKRVSDDSPRLLGEVLRESHGREIEMRLGHDLEYFEVRVFPLQIEQQQLGWAVILANTTAQHMLLRELRLHAETDELTGAANRRSFLAAMKREHARSVRHQISYSVLFVDVDNFKHINDGFGHAAGDRVLSAAAGRLATALRGSDLLGRYGGDEFAILLPETNLESARQLADRVRELLAAQALQIEPEPIHITVSIGVSSRDTGAIRHWTQLLERADQALYDAKTAGRNRVAVWQGSAPPQNCSNTARAQPDKGAPPRKA
jgi:diguanylate cyclase (GGDEF)-like protein